jgi:phospholipid/cholesterol/gamma-HCH transport system substrate-binding protein
MQRHRLGARPPYKTVGLVTIVVTGLLGFLLYGQFRGEFTPKTTLTMVAPGRAW